jgi:putative ATP-dependent endonuclease of OLD family
MRISRIRVENFRNFKLIDVPLSEHVVIVGENRVGKSNLLFALRLILDPSLPDWARRLRGEDFWDGLESPLASGARIEISVDLTDFEDSEDQLALLSDHLVEPEPMVARLTYAYQPRSNLESAPSKESDYEFVIYGGGRIENTIGHELRFGLPMDLLAALRDAEGDLANWRKSPLRPLLDTVASKIDGEEIEDLATEITDTTAKVTGITAINELGESISQALTDMVGATHGTQLSLGFGPADPDRLIRALRLFIDGGRRGIPDSSLGAANVLYLVLTTMRIRQSEEQGERGHTFLAIEEPEAHLHPHLQRCVFGSFLASRHGLTNRSGDPLKATVLLTTHSPHIVSISPVESLLLLRHSTPDGCSVAVSAAEIDLSTEEHADIERYLDVTRGEIVFARGVILVEGEAEMFLVPALAKRLGHDLDRLGITVCSIGGTHFLPYIKLLGPKGLQIPFAVVTDEDPTATGKLGVSRLRKLVEYLLPDATADNEEEVLSLAKERGLYLTEHTFEVAMWKAGRRASLRNAFLDLVTSSKARERAKKDWKDEAENVDFAQMLRDIEGLVGKGRFAQRWAARIITTTTNQCPASVREAIDHVIGQIT